MGVKIAASIATTARTTTISIKVKPLLLLVFILSSILILHLFIWSSTYTLKREKTISNHWVEFWQYHSR
ncbi:MAG: DUF2391 family protein [Candidatus Omnitrophota bacterium]